MIVSDRFGSLRGAVRLGLSYAEVASGLAPVIPPVADDVRRVVFVCHGNICRSAFAEAVAHRAGLSAASFGLSIASGQPAHAPVIALAERSGLDLTQHRTTSVDDFVPEDGDFLLAMEVRQLRRLAANERLAKLPRALLGSYAPVPVPHLHDPYGLSEAYMASCLQRIEQAVTRLRQNYPAAATS